MSKFIQSLKPENKGVNYLRVLSLMLFVAFSNYAHCQSKDTIYKDLGVTVIELTDSLYYFNYYDNGELIQEGAAKFNPEGYDQEVYYESPYKSIEEYLISGHEYYGIVDDFLLFEGLWVTYNKNETKYDNYEKGLLDGTNYALNKNGDTLYKTNYASGLRHGLSLTYNFDPHCCTVDTATYLNGEKHGYFCNHYVFGQIKERGQYQNDQKTGVWKKWDAFGQMKVLDYQEDKIVSNSGVELIIHRNTQKGVWTSLNGQFGIIKNGKNLVVYDLNKKKVVSGNIPYSFRGADMGETYHYLSPTGKNIVTNCLNMYSRWSVFVDNIYGAQLNEEFDNYLGVEGSFHAFDSQDKSILYSKGSLFRTYFNEDQSYESELDDIVVAGFSIDDQTIYAINNRAVFFLNEKLETQDTMLFHEELSDENFNLFSVNKDQLLILTSEPNTDNNGYLCSRIEWYDLKAKRQKDITLPADLSKNIFPNPIGFEFLHSKNGEFVILNLPEGSNPRESHSMIYYGNDWVNFEPNGKPQAINYDNQIIWYNDSLASMEYFNPLNKKSTFLQLEHSEDIQNVSNVNEGLVIDLKAEQAQDVFLILNTLAISESEGTDSIVTSIDSSFLQHFENLRRYAEVLSYLDGDPWLGFNLEDMHYVNSLYFLDSIHSIWKTSYIGNNNVLTFENRKKTERMEQIVSLVVDDRLNVLFFTPDKYYASFGSDRNLAFFQKNMKAYPFEQFDLKYNRPDIILDRLGYADSALIFAYHSAYQKRLKKMGFTEDMLEDDFHLPEIKIENFESIPTIIDEDNINLNLHLEDSKYKLDRINIWINDVAIYGKDGISLRKLHTQNLDKTIQIDLAKGINKIQVSVLNQAGAESYKETIEITCNAGKDKPDLYVIAIGESKFQQSDFNLTYASKDAKDIASIMTTSKAYANVFSKTLVNEQVTKENVLALSSFLEKADINDHVIVFLAGHGVLSADLDYYLATYDMDFGHPEKKGLAYEDLEGLLDGIKPLKKTMIIDACHSGEIDKEEVLLVNNENIEMGDIQFRTVGANVKSKLGTKNTLELTKSLFIDLRKGTGATVISSAGGMEFAMESDEWNNGLFTYTLLNGLKSGKADLNNDGEIWLSELQKYVSTEVTEMSNGLQQPTSRIENQTVDFKIW